MYYFEKELNLNFKNNFPKATQPYSGDAAI